MKKEGTAVFLKRSGGVEYEIQDRDQDHEEPWTSGDPDGELDGTVRAAVPVVRSSLGPDTVVSGRLSFTAPTRIDGTLRGEVRATDLLVIGEKGFIDGVVRAQRLIVLGEVRGEVREAERVEICRGGRLFGVVEARSLVVKDGGCLDGDCSIAPLQQPPPKAFKAAPALGSA
jgi:cytoskeletal protein CcmA (bactofilin family)